MPIGGHHRCERCGAQLSRYNDDTVCAPCQTACRSLQVADGAVPLPAARLPQVPLWLWTSSPGQAVLATRDLGVILRAYRQATGLSQAQLGELLAIEQPYLSRIETGRRTIRDIRMLAGIARRLAIPPHALGLASDDGGDLATMLAFGGSTLRLAEIARQTGRALDAVNELWPLVTRLEARVIEGRADPEVLVLLAQGRLSLGVALGHVLPEEQLTIAARWTARAWALARRLGDPALQAHALRMHGNELRKCGHRAAGASAQWLGLRTRSVPA